MPSLKTPKDRGHRIPFKLIKQHASNTGLIIDCNECSKPRLVYTAKRLTEAEKKLFNRVMNDMMHTGGTTLAEFKDPSNRSNCRYDIFNKCFVRANNSCSKPVEPLYYTCNYPQCCVHCGSKQRLTSGINENPMCTTFKVLTPPPPPPSGFKT